jgi:Fe-S-cluster containining protein
MRTVRLAILGDSPCGSCYAACCKRNGHAFAVLLQGEIERRRFAPYAVDFPFDAGAGRVVLERVLPYGDDGRCRFLGEDDRCLIYDDRPRACRTFQCVTSFNELGLGRHGRFLGRNPRVRAMLEAL